MVTRIILTCVYEDQLFTKLVFQQTLPIIDNRCFNMHSYKSIKKKNSLCNSPSLPTSATPKRQPKMDFLVVAICSQSYFGRTALSSNGHVDRKKRLHMSTIFSTNTQHEKKVQLVYLVRAGSICSRARSVTKGVAVTSKVRCWILGDDRCSKNE